MNEVTLALGGGGIKGISHLGVLRILEKSGYKINAIAGTSAGSIVGALYAAGNNASQIERIVLRADQKRLFKRSEGEGPSLLGLSGLMDILIQELGDLDFDDLKIPFACTAVDINSAQEMILNNGKVIDAIHASIAIPGVFPPKDVGEMRLVDGGVMDPVPVALARYLNPALPVIAVCLSPSPEKWSTLRTVQIPPQVPIPAPIIHQISKLRISQAMQIFVKSLDISARLLSELRMQVDKPEIIIRPDLIQYGSLDEVSPEDLITLGEEAAQRALPEIEELFHWRNRITRKIFPPDAPLPGKVLNPEKDSPDGDLP